MADGRSHSQWVDIQATMENPVAPKVQFQALGYDVRARVLRARAYQCAWASV